MKAIIVNLFRPLLICLAVITVLASCDKDESPLPTPEPSASATLTDPITVPFFVVTEDGEMPSDDGQLLYEARQHNPLLAPDGHQLTWGEFSSVKGEMMAECTDEGTRVSLNLSGLIPYGQYTLWNVTFEAPGMDPTQEMLGIDGLGAAGIGDGSDNAFVANRDGEASITLVSPGGELSLFGSAGACTLTDNFEWHLVGAYHIDGRVYGPDLGPDGTVAEQFGFIHRNGN
ncbi:MAG: hypothetical protein KDC43_15645 [Saprospiraceae bacterium]|nr:hypothetical protein [Saprospiraceae bacterium]MCB0625308.1 hypothetical protein [Saprospiraceae bacterium]MCB0675605.1 hypothetical protein [Saprospiraceae bacterium]